VTGWSKWRWLPSGKVMTGMDASFSVWAAYKNNCSIFGCGRKKGRSGAFVWPRAPSSSTG